MKFEAFYKEAYDAEMEELFSDNASETENKPSKDSCDLLMKKANLEFTADQVAGLYLNIRYENGVLSCITGTSLKVFTLDKRLEYEWDETVRQYFKKKQVPFT